MKLRHATPARNRKSILRDGLLTGKSRGPLPVVWFHTAGRTPWAILHTAKRHGAAAEKVIVLSVNVPRTWLKRTNKAGIWQCVRDVPSGRLTLETEP